jgi:hypothetical protein
MPSKFERLEIGTLALEYADRVYDLAERLPKSRAIQSGFAD